MDQYFKKVNFFKQFSTGEELSTTKQLHFCLFQLQKSVKQKLTTAENYEFWLDVLQQLLFCLDFAGARAVQEALRDRDVQPLAEQVLRSSKNAIIYRELVGAEYVKQKYLQNYKWP